MLSALKEKRLSIQAKLAGSGAVAHGPGAVAAGAGGVAVAGDVRGNVYVGSPPRNPEEALAIYRRVLAQTCGRLPLRGIDVGAADASKGQQPLGLANVYVELDTTTRLDLEREIVLDTRMSMGARSWAKSAPSPREAANASPRFLTSLPGE